MGKPTKTTHEHMKRLSDSVDAKFEAYLLSLGASDPSRRAELLNTMAADRPGKDGREYHECRIAYLRFCIAIAFEELRRFDNQALRRYAERLKAELADRKIYLKHL